MESGRKNEEEDEAFSPLLYKTLGDIQAVRRFGTLAYDADMCPTSLNISAAFTRQNLDS